jgi:predicted DNA-binding transcriptional regulator AlpA
MNDQLEPYLGVTDVARLFNVSERSIHNWRRAGKLPEPDKLPSGRPCWRESVLRNYVKQGAAA